MLERVELCKIVDETSLPLLVISSQPPLADNIAPKHFDLLISFKLSPL